MVPPLLDVNLPHSPLAAALDYAARGWAVIPLHTVHAARDCSCGAPACSSPGKHPRTSRGTKDATGDLATIHRWWTTWPEANVGVATGAASGLVVLDVDAAKHGPDTLAGLAAEHGSLPTSPRVRTGGGGFHVYFRHPGGRIANNAGKLGPGLDLRGDAGYVVAPPSRHASGHRYEWDPQNPITLPLVPFPAWLIEGVIAKPRSVSTQDSDEPIPDGQRNVTLTSLAGRLRRDGLSEAAIAAALQVTNSERCDPPLDGPEVEKIARSVAQYPTDASRLGFELEKLKEEHARSQALTSATIGVAENPHLRVQAPIALRIATLVESGHHRDPTPDKFYRISDALIADARARNKPIRGRTTISRARKQLASWHLFEIETRAGTQIVESVNAETGEISRHHAPIKETWVRRDRPLLEKLEQLAHFVQPGPDTHGGRRGTIRHKAGDRQTSGGDDIPDPDAPGPSSMFHLDTYKNVITGGDTTDVPK